MGEAMALAGGTALVTGSARGIGKGVALALARAGADVAVNYRQSRREAEAVSDAVRALRQQTLTLQADMTEPRDAAYLVNQVVEAWGKLDILVNNVGGYLEKPLAETSLEELKEMVASNIYTAFNGCQAALAHMRTRGSGRIVNIAVAGTGRVQGYRGIAAYAIAKTGVQVLTRSLALEEATHGITINCVSPGLIETEHLVEADRPKLLQLTPQGRLGTPADVAEVVLFLVSDEAEFITGAEIVVSGGFQV